MKNTISLLISVIVATLLFSGCKKYEEDPFLTLRSVKSRLTNGDWELDKLTIGGVDSTLEYSELEFNYSIKKYEGNTTSKTGAKSYTYSMSYTYMGELIDVDNGFIYFREEGDVIVFEPFASYSSYYYSPIFNTYDPVSGNYIEWDIIKLTNKEFWLETKVGGEKVEMKLKKVK